MNSLNELEALVILTRIPYLGSIKIKLLLQQFGSAIDSLAADSSLITELPGFGAKIANEWGSWKQKNHWQRDLELAERHRIKIIPYTSAEYPKRLLTTPDHPILLYVKGEIKECDQQGIAVVGTRDASVYGNQMAEKISCDLTAQQFTVVSGLARGIDTSAHHGALSRGRTIAVIGSGLADIYPRENIALAEAIAEKGALISEFPMETPPNRQNFPQRNRIVSGMTMGTLLIEAPIKSGAMITVEKALSQKRKVFALPGRVDNENFQGNHLLIKTGRAQLVESARDIAESFFTLFDHTRQPTFSPPPLIQLEEEEKLFLSKLPKEELSIDEMMQITNLSVMKINILLMTLILKRAIKEFPGKIYRKMT